MIGFVFFAQAIAASAPTGPICNEVCVYYSNRGATVLADERGIRNAYSGYLSCLLGLANTRDWTKVADASHAQSFLDESWNACAFEREKGDGIALAIAQKQLSDLAQAKRAVDEDRALKAYITASVAFQNAGRGGQMTDYVIGVRAKLAPDLDRK